MTYVAILAGNRETGGVSPAQAEAARHAAQGDDIHWLAHELAVEFHVRASDHALAEALIRASLGDAAIDVAASGFWSPTWIPPSSAASASTNWPISRA
jgi:hypothetical protein